MEIMFFDILLKFNIKKVITYIMYYIHEHEIKNAPYKYLLFLIKNFLLYWMMMDFIKLD
jgi:hypothetical protein